MSNGQFDKIFKSVLTIILAAAVLGLVVMYGTVQANTVRPNTIEPVVKTTADDISTIKSDIAVIKNILEREQRKEGARL